MTDDTYSAPKETKGDHAHKLIRSAIGAVPFVGPAGVEIFSSVFSAPLVKRNEDWMNNIADGLKRLEAQGDLKIEQLADNDVFIDVLLTATRIAAQTSNALKQKSLVNAVLNASKDQKPDEALQQMFLERLLSMTEWHLRVLTFLNQPYPCGLPPEMVGVPEENRNDGVYHDSTWPLWYREIFVAIPELADREDFVKLIVEDIKNLGFFLERGVFKVTTLFVDQFLEFIGNQEKK